MLHIVPHQHFDLLWRRPSEWYRRRRRELLLDILRFLDRSEHATFTLSQTAVLREFLETNPQCHASIRRHLHSGRLEIVQGCESIADLNLSRGTSLVCNILDGNRWLDENFAYRPRIGGFADAFGTSAQFAQLLKLTGFTAFKADRIPLDGTRNLAGDFVLQALDGSQVHAVNAPAEGNNWGWGFPDNPDASQDVSEAERGDKLRHDILAAARVHPQENILFVITGEEHTPYMSLPELLDSIRSEDEVECQFSTFTRYYESLSESHWNEVPVIPLEKHDISRIFTACYTSRINTKLMPRRLEHDLITAEFATFANPSSSRGDTSDLDAAWKALFLMQFHDSIGGCHIDENNRVLSEHFATASERLSQFEKLMPWQRLLPKFDTQLQTSIPIDESVSREHRCGRFTLRIYQGRLDEIMLDTSTLGPLCTPVLREDSGTLWTEEYSDRIWYPEPAMIDRIEQTATGLRLTVSGQSPTAIDMWPGFSSLCWRATFELHNDAPVVRVMFDIDFLGNSTEIALRWHPDDTATPCLAEIPFGSVPRHAYTPSTSGFTGHAFPALNWVKCANFAILNRCSPAHAIRDSHLETLLLRSPVKRWAPLFPVTPTEPCWDNGKHRFEFMWIGDTKNMAASDLHRAGMEFNASDEVEYRPLPKLEILPANLVVDGLCKTMDGTEAIIFEADGNTASWTPPGTGTPLDFNPHEVKRITLQS